MSRISLLEARIFGNTPPLASGRVAVRCDQIQIPEFIVDKFEEASRTTRPDLSSGSALPMNEGINAFLLHYKEDAVTSSFSGDFLLQTPTQSPAQYLRMMKTIWIIQTVLECTEYKEACQNGNRLLRCFVEGLAQKSLDEFNRFADGPRGNPYKVRNEPSEEDLSPLGKDAFAIWPKPVRQPDRFDTASMDSLKIVLRAALQLPPTPYLAPTSSRHKELLLLRHNSTLLEMVVRETWQADQYTNSQSYVFSILNVHGTK
jgi:hypothetical protein